MKQQIGWFALAIALGSPSALAQDTQPTGGTEGEVVAQTDGSGAAAAAADAQAAVEQQADTPAGNLAEGNIEDDVEEGETTELPWRNSIFIFDQSFNTYAFIRGSQLTYNPTYAWSFSIRPRWYFNDDLYMTVRQDMDLELTDSDSNTRNREPILSDTLVTLTRRNLVEWEGFKLTGAGRLILPLSISSRANSLYLGTAAIAVVNRSFDGVMKGLDTNLNFNFTHNWAGSNVVSTETDYPCYIADADRSQVCSQVGGPSTVSNSISVGPDASLSVLDNFTIDVSFTWFWRLGHNLDDATIPIDTGTITLEDGSETHWRNLTWFTLGVGYDVNEWLNLSGGLSTYTSQLNPDGSYRNPIYNVDSTVSLTATLTVDQLYTQLQSSSQAEQEAAEQREAANRQQQQAANRQSPARW